MRGYGRSSAPADPLLYTPFHTVGDLVGLLDALELPTVTIVGHDFGASIAWIAALLRPDRFGAVFGVSVPFMPLGEGNFLQDIADSGASGFYMFDQMKPEAAAQWADAAVTYPAFLYWSSASPPPAERWDPFAGTAGMVHPAPVALPPWADAEDIAYAVSEFERTGFGPSLSYYNSLPPFFELSGPFKGLVIHQPSFYLVGALDSIHQMRPATEEQLRAGLPGLRGFLELPEVGHWVNREAPDAFNDALLSFLRGL